LQSLHARTARLGVADRVHFVGRVPHEELPGYYNAADVGVWPGKLGVSIIEAIGTGLPIVVCDSEATSFLTAYDNGLVFPRKDCTALVDRLTSYLSDEELRTAHGARAVEYATERLSWAKIAERSIELYRAGDERVGETEATGRRAATESTTHGTVRP
jgi:glycosyltransferase involved in cell wall biosynthesis